MFWQEQCSNIYYAPKKRTAKKASSLSQRSTRTELLIAEYEWKWPKIRSYEKDQGLAFSLFHHSLSKSLVNVQSVKEFF